jgi:hypothetical protein
MNETITDPTFSTLGTAASKWELEEHEEVKLEAQVEDGSIVIHQKGAKGIHWHGEFRYAPFPVRKGETVALTFEARAETPTGFSAWIGKYKNPWTALVNDDGHFGQRVLQPEWERFDYEVEILASEDEARLNFVFGEKDNVICFRNISLKTKSEPVAAGKGR